MVNLTKERLVPRTSGTESDVPPSEIDTPREIDAGPGTLSRLYTLIMLTTDLFQFFKWILGGIITLFAALGEFFS
ncbi:hypothetical protein [Deinococcus soli (ex Cha et al. 2016)]|uniref:Uncharacterized protein n=2 Tax=Deinococcus soli (ex Cha et al. 2016) TaxID=1309411 RepID=A0AAE4BMS0_9DEIO|nr:hypothetical protein [Deinococcus soli (ex Cha et al. 2016)]MDR6218782.1 hypothetical protein [Deinococcus soli (ex Cha et al. 2016)]MDR6328579.1 hypothetical protein [Deinococcus soli (ex Cha et al. 2016)]MDR6751934.1 hypothetical protein [Deinococcus soli (ex Cha et al. 2016)]